MPDPQVLSAPSQSLRESPAWSAGEPTFQRGSPHNGARSDQAAVRSQNKIRIFSGVRRTPSAVFPWVKIICKKDIRRNHGLFEKLQIEKKTRTKLLKGMDYQLVATLFLDRIAAKAAHPRLFPPSKKRSGTEQFNVSRLVQAVWPGKKSKNNQEWTNLRNHPEKLKLVDAIKLSQVVGSDFVRDMAGILDMIEKDPAPMYAKAAEIMAQYGEKKAVNHDLS